MLHTVASAKRGVEANYISCRNVRVAIIDSNQCRMCDIILLVRDMMAGTLHRLDKLYSYVVKIMCFIFILGTLSYNYYMHSSFARI